MFRKLFVLTWFFFFSTLKNDVQKQNTLTWHIQLKTYDLSERCLTHQLSELIRHLKFHKHVLSTKIHKFLFSLLWAWPTFEFRAVSREAMTSLLAVTSYAHCIMGRVTLVSPLHRQPLRSRWKWVSIILFYFRYFLCLKDNSRLNRSA